MRKTKDILTTGEIAKICRVSPRTVSEWIDCGHLKGYRIPISQDRRVTVSSLFDFLHKNNMPAAEDVWHLLNHSVIVVGACMELAQQLPKECERVDNLFDLALCLSFFGAGVVLFDLAGSPHSDTLCAIKSIKAKYRNQYQLHVLLYDGAEVTPEILTEAGADKVFRYPFQGTTQIYQLLEPCMPTVIPEAVNPSPDRKTRGREIRNGRTEETA